MGRAKQTAVLDLFMNGILVGHLTRTPTGALRFQYALEWVHSSAGRPLSLSMPLKPEPYSGEIPENFFDNLLPDSPPIRNRIQTRFGTGSNRCFDLLWHVGRDCVGALQLLPAGSEAPQIRRIDAVELTEAKIAETLRNYATLPLGMSLEDDFRISIAGAQEKTAFLKLDDKWCRPLGGTPTSHIFKLPIGNIQGLDLTQSVENEWLCHLVFKAYGIPIAEAEMASFEDIKTLVVKRFDRRWAEDGSWIMRLPQEDMCQALGAPAALKYERDGGPGIAPIMNLLLGSERALADRGIFLKTQMLFWLLGAIDGHAKNFSVFILPRGGFRLTPIYDVMSAWPLVAKRQIEGKKLKMGMGVKGKSIHYVWDTILRRHWMEMAKMCHFPHDSMETIIAELIDQVDAVIDKVSSKLPSTFPAEVADTVFDGMKKAGCRLRG